MWSRKDLAYCSNVHQSETLDDLFRTISTHITNVRNKRCLPEMASGLWISKHACTELQDNNKLELFIKTLEASGLYVYTLNGFPYGNFHSQIVKEDVYSPDWSSKQRLDYTLQLASILTRCMPEYITTGTISTLPLGYKKNWCNDQLEASIKNIFTLCLNLDQLYESSGKSVKVCLEMEPGCVLEKTEDTIQFFTETLPNFASRMKYPVDLVSRYLGVCYDVCHQAVMFEDARQSLTRLAESGISIAKIQISNALEVYNENIELTRKALSEFSEQKYLHQTYTQQTNGIYGVMDLDQAFNDPILSGSPLWRIHYHIPIQIDTLTDYGMKTTQNTIIDVLSFLSDNKAGSPHIEVETYTWQVLPQSMRPTNEEQLAYAIAEEIKWLEQKMLQQNILS